MNRWSWLSPLERRARDEHIREQYAMGKTYAELAEEYDLSAARIRQIVGNP